MPAPSKPIPPTLPSGQDVASLGKRLSTDTEYVALRAEITFWQNLRLTILGFDFAFVGGVLASDTLSKSPWISAVLVVSVLFGSKLLIWHGARSSLCIGAYIRVFYEEPYGLDGWEARLRKRTFFKWTQFSNILSLIMYLMLVMAYLPLIQARDKPFAEWFDQTWGVFCVVLTSCFVVVSVLVFLTTSRYRRMYIDMWRSIREEETHIPPTRKYRLHGYQFELIEHVEEAETRDEQNI